MSIIDNKEQTKRIEMLAKTIETLDQRVVQSKIMIEDRLETRLNVERVEQDKRFESLIMLQGARASEVIKRISMDTNMMIAKCMSDTNTKIESETQKVFRQVAQTALDVDGIKNKLNTLDMDLQATEYEAIISPETTPYKTWANNDNKNVNNENMESPPFGEAPTK